MMKEIFFFFVKFSFLSILKENYLKSHRYFALLMIKLSSSKKVLDGGGKNEKKNRYWKIPFRFRAMIEADFDWLENVKIPCILRLRLDTETRFLASIISEKKKCKIYRSVVLRISSIIVDQFQNLRISKLYAYLNFSR